VSLNWTPACAGVTIILSNISASRSHQSLYDVILTNSQGPPDHSGALNF
jgi:hypothetical protein